MTELWLGDCYNYCVAIIKECASKEDADHFGPMLDKFGKKRMEILGDAVAPTGPFNTICHNDLSSNNVLFK